jgi:class 3 adenylate cyclase
MPIYMDVHPDLGDATPDDVAHAHQRDLAIQGEYGVKFLIYWVNAPGGKAFCLVESPDEDSVKACHKAAHGLMPHELVEISGPLLSQFLGDTTMDDQERVMLDGDYDTALRVIMFTDIVGSTDVSTSFGDEIAVALVELHDNVVRAALTEANGRAIKHTGDGVLASFASVSRAIQAAVTIQQQCAELDHDGIRLHLKIGMSPGESVESNNDIYGAAVNMAERICAHAEQDQILASGTVRDLAIGKPVEFVAMGAIGLKGFEDPVPLFEVPWRRDAN